MTAVAVEIRTRPTKRLDGIGPLGPERLALEDGQHYRFAFDMRACIGCHSCEAACSEQNGLPDGTAWRRVGDLEGGTFPAVTRLHMSMACNHCLEPACLQGCPTNAYTKLDNGIVAHDAAECIGCQYCTWNCPYSVPALQPDRRIVTKCDMCRSRLDAGREPACVEACPTKAITIEAVNVAAWRADHTAANAPNLPDASITISTTRIVVPDDMPERTVAASDHRIAPEDPHWPLVWLTLLTQWAVGVVVAGAVVDPSNDRVAVVGALLAAVAVLASFGHLGHPIRAWKAFRNLRHSWLSREALAFAVFAPAAGAYAAAALTDRSVAVPLAAACVVGVVGVGASAALYLVPGRPAWCHWSTVATFAGTGVILGPATVAGLTGSRAAGVVAAGAMALQLAVFTGNWLRMAHAPLREAQASARLLAHHLRRPVIVRLLAAVVGLSLAAAGLPWPAVVALGGAELIGRWLFYTSVVPLNMPGSFWREHR